MSTQARGSKAKIIYDIETTFKTTRSPADAHVLPFASESLRMSRNLIDSKTIRGNRNPQQPVRGNREVSGDLNVELDPYMGKMFYNALGTFTTKGSSPYSHTFVITELPVGMTFEKQFTDLDTAEYFVYNGCKINSFKASFKSEGFIDSTFNIIGAAETVTTTSFDATPTDYSTSAVGGAFDGFEATIKEGGSTLGTCTEIDFTLENNLDSSVYVIDGTGTRYSLPDGMVKVSGTVKCLFDSMTLYNKAINNQETSLQITLQHGTGSGAAYNERLEIYLDEVLLQPNAPVVSGPTGVLVELPFTAYYKDSANASALRFILWNTQTQAAIMQ